MTSFKILHSKNGYSVVQPSNNFHESYGFIMVVAPNREVLKFFRSDARQNAVDYCDYISLSRYEKLKYWWNYKRGEK